MKATKRYSSLAVESEDSDLGSLASLDLGALSPTQPTESRFQHAQHDLCPGSGSSATLRQASEPRSSLATLKIPSQSSIDLLRTQNRRPGGHIRRRSSIDSALSPSLRRAPSTSSLRVDQDYLARKIPLPAQVLSDIDLARLRRWVVAFMTVQFDIDNGPLLDNIWPPYALTSEERMTVAFASFPDSSSQRLQLGAQTFVWRLPGNDGKSIWGAVFFDRARAADAKRGFHQRSLVIGTSVDAPGLFSYLVTALGQRFLGRSEGAAAIAHAAQNIINWPSPSQLGGWANVPFLGKNLNVLNTAIAEAQQKPPLQHHVIANVPLRPLSQVFAGHISELWTIWELLILGEPILVYAAGDAARASDTVMWLRSLVRPLPFDGELRPYLTLQDHDFAKVCIKTKPRPGLLVGTSNGIIRKACQHWPHVITFAADGHGRVLSSTHRRCTRRDDAVLQAAEQAAAAGNFIAADDALCCHFRALTERFLAPLSHYVSDLRRSPAQRSMAFHETDFLKALRSQGSPLVFRMRSFDGEQKKRSVAWKPRWLRRPTQLVALTLFACIALSTVLALPSQHVQARATEQLLRVVESLKTHASLYPADVLSHASARKSDWPDWYRQAGHLSKYLLRREVPLDRTLFVIIADHTYVPAIRNFDQVLRQHGHSDAVVTLCLSIDCIDRLEEHSLIGYHGYLNQSVADIKLHSNIDLAKTGYNFVFADGDVYLNPAFDPLHGMLPLSDQSWDIQMSWERNRNQTNIGWYFIRSSDYSIGYLERCLETMTRKPGWDQAIYDNEYKRLRKEAEYKGELDTLRIKILSCENNMSWMREPWQATYGNATAMAAHVAQATTIHFTCIEKNVKLLFAHLWGLWQDLDGYYSRPRPLLRLPHLNGTVDELRQQWTFARRLGTETGRQVIFPEYVTLFLDTRAEERPGFRVFYIDGDELLHSIVSSSFTEIREARGLSALSEQDVKPDTSLAALKDAISRFSSETIAVLPDFSVAARIYAESSRPQMLPMCEFIDWPREGCLRVCGNPA
ncbi:uncharacterized protein L969DRAFT_45108 [Mixia osmundae IAM 14324]|uniref:UDENN domain-containing protein n=1 Tax=Mixia osmundae (strain CBS 9802 / IAM 14324 / JCM 22182 / KY 12970) TaxID=764103 RepID=G7DU08_MIXOS|nr:uncharacterized protein L969DRAFT_45108 [Mixia osmundae IAM 14324]KEI41781.1 hypothetical protein L969DRAFT_45108 [Mixia osmundae IAM 14324]GAA94068.1 hypothetical protein E5Q_00715 [Mixia osmundae IAM 14324]